MTAPDPKSFVKVPCSTCSGGFRNHTVHFSKERKWHNEGDGVQGSEKYEVVQCMGCDSLRFRAVSWDTSGPFDDEWEPQETVTVYPQEAQRPTRPSRFNNLDPIPEKVLGIYTETIQAFNFGAPTLAGAGLRAIVEALCIHQEVTGRNLQQMIDGLVGKGLLARPQADALHEERFLGNSALHEIAAPSKADLDDGLQIVETLLHTIFVLPEHVARMKKKREEKAAKKNAGVNPDAESDDVSG